MSWIKIKSILLYSMYSIVVAIVIVEVLLRLFVTPFSTGNGSGIGRKWSEIYWQPVNSDGYRDEEVELRTENKLVVTIGDSFTAGYGVSVSETYSALLRKKLGDTHDIVNLGDNGASTVDERKNLSKFIGKYKKTPDLIIYQYFGNDISDLADVDDCFKFANPLGRAGKFLSKISYLYGLYDAAFFQNDFSSCYITALKAAYHNKEKFAIHKKEVKDFVSSMRSENNNIIMIAFPYLNNDEVLRISEELYIADLRDEFLSFCKSGDWFLDPSPIALNLSINDRVANFLDAHPSAPLHALVAAELERLISNAEGKVLVEGTTPCK